MLLEINFLLLLFSAVFATPPISDIDEKGLKSDSNDKLTNSIDDSLDDRPKRSYESGGYQWGSPSQADPFNPAYSPPNNYYGFGRSGNDFQGASNNPFQQPPFDGGQPNNGKNPFQEIMGKALESVIVQSVRQLLDMTPLGSGQGDSMRSARSARSVENVLKILDHTQEKNGKVNMIEKLGSIDVKDSHTLEKRDTSSGEEDDDSEENPELIRQQTLQQNIMKEMKRRKRMKQQAYLQSLLKNQEKIESQQINQQKDLEGSWEQGMDDEQKLEYLSNYQKQLMDLYREKQSKSRVDRNGGKTRGGSKQSSSRYSPPQQGRTMIGNYPNDRQEVSSKYYDQRKNKVKPPFLSSKYSQIENNNSRFAKESFEQGQDFFKQNSEFEKAPQNSMMNNMGQRNSDWGQRTWDQSNQFVQQQSRTKDNSIRKLSNRSMTQQNLNQRINPEEVSMQDGWRSQTQQTPQNQQFYNEFPTQNSMMSQQIPKISNGIAGKQRFQRISNNEICKDGFTPSGIPCSMETTTQNQMSDGSYVNSPPSNQEMLLQPPTLIKRYVTYSNRFIPPPTAVMEPVTDQEMLSGEGSPQRSNSIERIYADNGDISSQEQRSRGNEGMMNGWTGQ